MTGSLLILNHLKPPFFASACASIFILHNPSMCNCQSMYLHVHTRARTLQQGLLSTPLISQLTAQPRLHTHTLRLRPRYCLS